MSHKKLWFTVGALVALFMLFAVDANTGIAQTPCADYISGGAGNPTTTEEFYVGTYVMFPGGDRIEVRCDTYVGWS